MKGEGRIIELLIDQLKQQALMAENQAVMGAQLGQVVNELVELRHQVARHERYFHDIVEILRNGVPRFNEVIQIEQLSGGRVILHKDPGTPVA